MWLKRGLIFFDEHAQLPTPYLLNNDTIRIFYSTKIGDKSYIKFIDVKADNPYSIAYIEKSPILQLGERGTFDDSGMMPSCVALGKYLFYTGWSLGRGVPYRHAIGCINIRDGFERMMDGPLLDRCESEPYLCNSAVWVETGFICYCSGTGWIDDFPVYEIAMRSIVFRDSKHLISRDKSIIMPNQGIYAISRPWVLHDEDMFKMWFASKGKVGNYRMGYAFSKDGWSWTRTDDKEQIIGPTESKWDSEMVCYPAVLKVKDKKYMFYNGNNYGGTGIGLAEWES